MKCTSWIGLVCLGAALLACTSCTKKDPPWGEQKQLALPGTKRMVWAVAPIVNLSGQKAVDPILQADLVYQQLQEIHGLTVIPVNRVVEVFVGMKIEKIKSEEQALAVCELLGCDALVVPTVTLYDPYTPPKLGASLQIFSRPSVIIRQKNVDVHALERSGMPMNEMVLPPPSQSHFVQAVGVYDASNGSVREAVAEYARGRSDPVGPLGQQEYFACMDRYCGFVYFSLATDLLKQIKQAS